MPEEHPSVGDKPVEEEAEQRYNHQYPSAMSKESKRPRDYLPNRDSDREQDEHHRHGTHSS